MKSITSLITLALLAIGVLSQNLNPNGTLGPSGNCGSFIELCTIYSVDYCCAFLTFNNGTNRTGCYNYVTLRNNNNGIFENVRLNASSNVTVF